MKISIMKNILSFQNIFKQLETTELLRPVTTIIWKNQMFKLWKVIRQCVIEDRWPRAGSEMKLNASKVRRCLNSNKAFGISEMVFTFVLKIMFLAQIKIQIYVVLCCVAFCCSVLFCAVLCCIVLCCVLLCHFLLCCVMLCHVMICYVM